MKIKPRKLTGVYEITLEPQFDERGFFMRTYNKKLFRKYNIDRNWVQENHSRSEKKGIIRGLHFQFPPYMETKLVRAVKGFVFDVFVDLRKSSPTLGEWDSIKLSEKNKKMIFIPKGFAHGFCALTKVSEIVYKIDNYYNQKAEKGIVWNDKALKIKWPTKKPILSKKDSVLMTFDDFIKIYKGL